jgi:hypothetical protein
LEAVTTLKPDIVDYAAETFTPAVHSPISYTPDHVSVAP